jgi:hypothetical protein
MSFVIELNIVITKMHKILVRSTERLAIHMQFDIKADGVEIRVVQLQFKES